MDDSKRLSLLEEHLSSTLLKTTFEKGKGLAKGSISRWLISFATEDKPTIVKVASPLSKENDKTELLNPADALVRLSKAHQNTHLQLLKLHRHRARTTTKRSCLIQIMRLFA